MKSVRFKYIFLILFTFLFFNLLSINVNRVQAEENIDISNAYRGEIADYWALLNYGESFIGNDTITIFLDPEAINNSRVAYIQINEFNQYGEIETTYFKRGVDSSFASRFNYTFVDSSIGEKSLTIFLLEDLLNKPTSIIERININDLERMRTIAGLSSADFVVSREVEEMTFTPYKVFVDIKENSCDYKLREVTYTYEHVNDDGTKSTITGSAILDTSEGAPCNRFYFTVSENAIYDITIEDHFGYIKPDENDSISITIDNFYEDVINIVATYDNALTNLTVPVYISVYDGKGIQYTYSQLEYLTYTDTIGETRSIMNLGMFIAEENGIYKVSCKTVSGTEATIEINITNIDRTAPVVFASDYININSSDVESRPYVFDPFSYVLATDNASQGDNLVINTKYYYVSGADATCKVYQGNELEYDLYNYLYGVNDVCVEYEVWDEAGNSAVTLSKIVVSDNTIPTVTYSIKEVILQIGDDMPTNEQLIIGFGLEVDDNSRLYDSTREITITSDLSAVNLEELNRYPIYISAIDASGNESEVITLTVVVTERILVIDAVPNQYIVYGEEMIEILYTCNGNPCIGDLENAEILPADWGKLTGELYITSGAKYSGKYTIYSNLAINSKKYTIKLGNLGEFTIKQRTFKIIANSYSIDYKDDEPVLTWYMDTSVCNEDLSTKYTSYSEINYSCTFVSGDDFGGGAYPYEEKDGILYYAGGISREPGFAVKYDAAKNVIYYKILVGDLRVLEVSNGGRDNYYLDFYGLYEDNLYPGYARFYIYPKYVEITFSNVSKIYGENDPVTTYVDEDKNAKKEDGKGNVQYEFTCFSYKKPINTMTTAECQQEIQMVINRENGENVGRYKIIGDYLNENYEVMFNEEHESGALPSAYLNILKRDIEMSIDGTNGDGKYTIFYEDALPVVTISINNDPNITYQGLASNAYLNINDNSVINFADRLTYGDHPVKYIDQDGNVVSVTIGGFSEYISGVGTYTITRDTITILNILEEDVLNNYNLKFNDGELTVLARQIYIKVVDGLSKIYGDEEPSFNNTYVNNTYGEDTNYVVDGSGHYILQIINTLENTEIVDRDDYEPFDKDKLKYYLKRSIIRVGYSEVDIQDGIHDGQVVGKYLVSCDRFENDSNYIIDIYQDYYFEIGTREVELTIGLNSIEFNYQNKVPKFSYSISNLAFTDKIIGQPDAGGFAGSYRNNGTYIVVMGDMIILSSAPVITSIDNYWYINGEITTLTLEDYPSVDLSLINVSNGTYYFIDLNTNTKVDTGVAVKETNVMWNYTFIENPGFLEVVPRDIIIVPEDGCSKQYGDKDGSISFTTKHAGDLQIEAILDASDFTGTLSRESGEIPGTYKIVRNSLQPAAKGASYNFNIIGFESNHTFEITKRDLVIKHAASDENNNISIFYGDSDLMNIVKGYKTITGSEAYQPDLCTMEVIDGQEVCDPIYDTIAGSITSDPENAEDVGTYKIKNKDLHIVRVLNPNVDVTDYYNLVFIEATLTILPRIIYITPEENQTKIYGENDGTGSCGIKYSFSPELIKETDKFSGCLKRNSKVLADGRETSEDVGEYRITLGDLTINPNYELVLNGSVMYQITPRPITIVAKVMGDTVTKLANLDAYTMTYGGNYTLGYDIGGMGLANNESLGIIDTIENNVELSPEYKGVGTYLVVQGKLIVTNSRNYNITFVKATFVITKKVVTIRPLPASKIYGDPDPSAYLFEFVSEEVEYTGSLSRLPGETVGNYKIISDNLTFGENYELNLLEAYFEIKPRNVYVVADDKQKIYSYDDPEFTYTYTVEGDFELDTEFLGELSREDPENHGVGEYLIIQNNLSLNNNYKINYTPGIFTIGYVDFNAIEIYSLTDNKYQIQGSESQVRLYARFNKGADETHLGDVSWSIVKNDTITVEFEKDKNNVISFTPKDSLGVYVVTASYNGISATYEVIVRTNNVSNIHISVISGNVIQTLGLESEIVYGAEIVLFEDIEEELVIEWYASDVKVCEKGVADTNNFCAFTPALSVGMHQVYAKIGSVISEKLDLVIKDNQTPVITLEDQDVVYYIEAFQNATENSVMYIEPGYSAVDDVDGNITSKVKVKGVEDINYYKTGTYYIVYEVSDQHGHIANNYRTVVVEDTVAPTIQLNNPELMEIILEYGDEYTEYGATASDAYDDYYGNELTVFIDSDLNVNRVGTYEIIYFAIDSSGSRGQAIRTVKVQDTVRPVITLVGSEIMYLEYKQTFYDPGALFEDNYDGKYMIYATTTEFTPEGSETISEVSSVDTSLLGIYRLTYYQEDSSGNRPEATVLRTVVVRDSTPPVITLLGSNPYILRYGTEYIDPGYKVVDNYDGDITNNTNLVNVVEIIGDTLGTYYVYYNAKDTHNNIAQEVKREVIVLDLVSPIIYFTDACPQYITIEALVEEYDLRCNLPQYGYTVFDDYTPDIDVIQNWVEVSGTVDNTTIGTYEILYNVSDRSGNKAVTLTRYVNVVDTTPPSIRLLPNKDGFINFYVEVFTQYEEPGWVTSDLYDDYHGLEVVVNSTNNINVNKLNTYTVTYIATDTSGNSSEPIYREILVKDTVPPEVTLIGDAELTIERGSRYAEYGASAKDNYDGVINKITIEGAPTGKELGDFEVTYCARDSSGNDGCAIRLVHVVDTIPPTVLGPENGKYYRAPLYIYYAPLTGTDEILTGTLNGQLISSPWYVSKEGTYHLVVRDDAGNQTVIDFAIDMTPPTLYGANDGEYLNHPVTIYSNEVLSSITYKIDNGGFVSKNEQSMLFESEGEYWVYATDMAGNVSGTISFVIDMTPPAYSLQGVLNGGITSTDVTLITENDVIVSVNNEYIPTNYTFTENGYYQVTIRDKAGNDVFLQFVINKDPTVMISGKTVSFISQNNAILEFIAKANSGYPKGSGFIYAKPLLGGGFEYVSGTLFSDEEYSKLTNGEDIIYSVPSCNEDEMIVAFIVTLDELNKFTTQTVEGDDDSAIMYAIIALALAAILGGFFYFFIFVKRKKEEEEEEEEEVVEEEDTYY